MIPIKYFGSKSRIAKYIVPILQKEIDDNNIQGYYEPFVGGANIIDKINCHTKVGSDLNQYLIALLKYVQDDGELPNSVIKEEYDDARSAFNNQNTSSYDDWYIGAVGFLASYCGRWFDGGYAKPGYESTKNGQRYRDYYRESKDNLLKQVPDLKDIQFLCGDYRLANPHGMLIYCDPPYANTKQFANSKDFDHDVFWQTMRDWSKDNIVYISELNAPDDFECVWEQEVSRSIKATDKSKAIERLFRYKGETND